ncbi:Hvo_1808 family surface protein [Halorussus salinus]|uniref:Hvo_1808 family surface protein n=1 Tax=Halorussus salinus TaxID=1364935 RepID=UPI0010930D7E|nr:Hvo_1808 family surface protein [Halorussus salinus]
MRRIFPLLAFVVLTVGLAVAPGVAATQASGPSPKVDATEAVGGAPRIDDADACNPASDGSRRPDPESDELGWENGCWYDEPIAVDGTDGLNATELEAVVARSMARVETVRGLEFEGEPSIEFLSPQAFEQRIDERFVATEAETLRKNAKWEALLMVGEDTDAVEVLQSNAGGSRGYYSPTDEEMVFVVEDPESPRLNEPLLAHELVHVLQNQQFDAPDRFELATFELRRTTESQNAINSLIEGDSEYVQMQYADRCESKWDCVTAPERDDGSADPHVGMALLNSYPYYDGPNFVHAVEETGGWNAVNQLYDQPPTSTKQVMNPEAYPAEKPTTVDFTDTSDENWRIPEVETGQPKYASVGMPGITTMFVYTVFDTNRQHPAVLPVRTFYNSAGDGLDRLDPYRYGDNPYASGWEDDRLYPYATETGETGYVWKLSFETANDSEEFVSGYRELLTYYNASAVEDRTNTYRIPERDSFGDAYYVNRTGRTVVLVNAPGVAELSEIRAGAAPKSGGSNSLRPPEGTTGVLIAAGLLVAAALAVVGGRALLGDDE